MKQNIEIVSGSVFNNIADFFGGRDILLTSLILLILIDVLTGILKAIVQRSDKSEKGGLSSSVMFRGGIKKLFILILVAVASILDKIISPDELYVRSAVIGYYIANESISILENIGQCGIPLPKILYRIIDILKGKAD